MQFKPTDYDKFKQYALEKGVIRKIVSVSELDFKNAEVMSYNGTDFIVTLDAFNQFVKLLGLSTGVMKKVEQALGEKNSQQLLVMMKAAMSMKDEKHKICMLISHEGKIVGFRKSNQVVLSNKGYMALFEEVMNNNPGMQIKNMAITEGGNLEISTLNNNWQFNVAKLNDEFFKSGLTFVNTPGAMIVNPYCERLTCTNGNIVTEKGMSLILNSTEESHLNTFFDQVRNLKGALNVEDNMKQRIVKMMQTSASLAEAYMVRRTIEANVINSDFDRDVKATIEHLVHTKWLEAQFKAAGHDVLTMANSDLAKIRTDMNVWELANALTDIASNPAKHGVAFKHGVSSIFNMQREAGALMFKKRYDFEEPFTQIFNAPAQ